MLNARPVPAMRIFTEDEARFSCFLAGDGIFPDVEIIGAQFLWEVDGAGAGTAWPFFPSEIAPQWPHFLKHNSAVLSL